MGRLHRTPDHVRMLREVWDQRIVWDSTIGSTGGFRWGSGTPLQPGPELVALWECRTAGLLKVDAPYVHLSHEGEQRLAHWAAPAKTGPADNTEEIQR